MTRNEFPISITQRDETTWELVQGWTLKYYGVNRAWQDSNLWAVTHLASGLAVSAKMPSVQKAKKLAEVMERDYPWEDLEKLLGKVLEICTLVGMVKGEV